MVEGLGEDRAVDLSACAGHSAVVTDSGDLYTWGSSEDQGVLGHGAGKWQPTPKRVLGLKRVTKGASPRLMLQNAAVSLIRRRSVNLTPLVLSQTVAPPFFVLC